MKASTDVVNQVLQVASLLKANGEMSESAYRHLLAKTQRNLLIHQCEIAKRALTEVRFLFLAFKGKVVEPNTVLENINDASENLKLLSNGIFKHLSA